MLHLSLANLLNDLVRKGLALISEGPSSLIVSNLSSSVALTVARAANDASWPVSIVDGHGSEYELDEVHEDFGPFRIQLEKVVPSAQEQVDDLFLVTEVGFRSYLQKGHPAVRWRLLGLNKAFISRARVYCGWDDDLMLEVAPATKAPRLLVKESATVRTVPEDVRHWLLAEGQGVVEDNSYQQIWATHAFNALSRCVANEIDSTGNTLTFKGPPKLNLTFVQSPEVGESENVGLEDFQAIQEAAGWVFDNAREAEVKHILLSAEIARSGRSDGEVAEYFREHLAAALECAKIAYQMAVSEITKDTLKSLGDLRKAVTEEASKATDATRQAVAAIATALTVGLGLIAARLTVQINPYLITVVMVVALGYTAMNVFSGWKFIEIQQALRAEWQSKLYRFLSTAEFKKMVEKPIGDAEGIFRRVSIVGLSILGLSAIGVVVFAFTHSAPVIIDKKDPSGEPANQQRRVVPPAMSKPKHNGSGMERDNEKSLTLDPPIIVSIEPKSLSYRLDDRSLYLTRA